MRLLNQCQQCRDLQQVHDRTMDQYIDLVDEQSRLFRQGRALAARGLDVVILRIKGQREVAIDALLRHQADHYLTSQSDTKQSGLR